MIHSSAHCDFCEKLLIDEDGVDQETISRAGWFSVSSGWNDEDNQPEETWDFCTARCVSEWAKVRVEV